MSNSSDNRVPPPPPGHRQAPPRQYDPETRADRQYAAIPRRPGPAHDPWNDPASGGTWPPEPAAEIYGHQDDDFDPRTGPATFEFHPSPLQPRQPQRVPTVHPAGAADHRRHPQHPDDLLARDPATGHGSPAGHDRGQQHGDPFRQAPDARREPATAPTLSAPSRLRRSNREMAHTAIVPPGSVTGRSLTLVIAIMCFLACLTAGAVYLMNQSANAWLRDIASEITVQIEAADKTDIDRTVREVTAFLGRQPGVVAAKPLSLETSGALLEPWLGQTEGLKSLPIPRLIAVEIDRFNPPDFTALRSALTTQFKGSSLDDHRHWQQQIRTVTRSFALGGFAILMLVGAATTAIIVSATRSALASNRDIVEVLHFVGATDRFIASQFQRHFLSLGVRAGVVGAVLAGLAFLGIPVVMELLGGGTASVAEIQHLVGTGTLDLQGYGWLAAVVVVVAALCMFTSRIGVYRILHSQH